MNAVDRMDQVTGTNRTERKEQRLSMSVFLFIIDLAVNNAYQVYAKLHSTHGVEGMGEARLEFREFK